MKKEILLCFALILGADFAAAQPPNHGNVLGHNGAQKVLPAGTPDLLKKLLERQYKAGGCKIIRGVGVYEVDSVDRAELKNLKDEFANHDWSKFKTREQEESVMEVIHNYHHVNAYQRIAPTALWGKNLTADAIPKGKSCLPNILSLVSEAEALDFFENNLEDGKPPKDKTAMSELFINVFDDLTVRKELDRKTKMGIRRVTKKIGSNDITLSDIGGSRIQKKILGYESQIGLFSFYHKAQRMTLELQRKKFDFGKNSDEKKGFNELLKVLSVDSLSRPRGAMGAKMRAEIEDSLLRDPNTPRETKEFIEAARKTRPK